MKSKNTRGTLILLACSLAASLLFSSLAEAQMREFSGRIDRIGKTKMIVDNRMGDKVSFIPADPTVVSGEGKTSWNDLKQKDWVTVSWKMVDKPRKAYKVLVVQEKKEAGEEE